jgi:hypothetical protein
MMNDLQIAAREAIAALFTQGISGASEATEYAEAVEEYVFCSSRDELIAEFYEAAGLAEGWVVGAENLTQGTFTVASDARRRAEEALRLARTLAELDTSRDTLR